MSIKVALVEDNAGICEEVEHLVASQTDLRWLGAFRNLRTALSNIPPQPPDVLIMDISLPDGSGIDATAQFRRLLPHTRILMYTGHDTPETIAHALQAGADGHVPKRLGADALLRAIRTLRPLNRAYPPQAPGATPGLTLVWDGFR